AMDAIVEFDTNLEITRVNPAAEQAFQRSGDAMLGTFLGGLLSQDSGARLQNLIREITGRDRRWSWIPGGLQICPTNGQMFLAETTLSRSENRGRNFYTLILRNVNDRLEAERKIDSLTAEAEYLRQAVKSLGGFDRIVGESKALKEVLRDIEQVAGTDTTVLILGETGTGKELVARAIHGASRRRDKPLITVNCAAIPAALMESEFFGHEKGAFTGATQKREGCFALADGGTIFLDEVGELSLDLQAKLLRVLQEGEFTPVGASRLRKVDVRVIAATNRDLNKNTRDGSFRQDLYYRLNVFPIRVPPLRERGEDVVLLAAEFAAKFAQRMGKQLGPLSEECRRRLMAYSWPGNVRELQNVIERAVITARDRQLNLDRALPVSDVASGRRREPVGEPAQSRVLKFQELEALERENIRRALESCNWRVAGKDGAAAMLGMNSSTLSSRIKALGINRPR
ncbi:MAG: sigma 54-interacting transcriptional regulator, partial [Deltaproteobacteria bacterium]|nr:sigma 54-interacting transcriptional regulator [Deltaproteobacteria bacterium]